MKPILVGIDASGDTLSLALEARAKSVSHATYENKPALLEERSLTNPAWAF
jgi:hypothetical protein